MATSEPKYPGNPHLWRHPNGRWYIKTGARRRAVGTTDVQVAKERLEKYLATLPPVEAKQKPALANPKRELAGPHLWRHPNGWWYIRFRAADGQRTRKACNTQVEAEAKAVFERYKSALAAPARPEKVTVGVILDGYFNDHSPDVANPESVRYAIIALKAGGMGDLFPANVSDFTTRQYARKRQAQGRAPSTAARELQILRAALKWAFRQDPKWIDELPEFVMPVKGSPPRDRWLTKAEATRLMNACEMPHLRLYVAMALYTTKRKSAVLGLRWTDIRDGMVCFGQGRGNKRRGDVPVSPALAAELDLARELATTDWVVEYAGDRVRDIKKSFATACRRAGLDDVTPHVLRHTAATWMAMDGVPMQEIARVLGDSLAVTEDVYAKYHPDYLRRAVNAISLT